MIYLVLDFILSYFSKIPTFFFLINIVLIKKQELSKLIIIGLIIDILILNTYFLNTIILISIFLIYKKLKITKINIKNYILSLLLIYILYVSIIGLINKYSMIYILSFIINNIFYELIFYFLVYKIEEKNIKLSR